MVECSLCSIIAFFFGGLYNIVVKSLQYPVVLAVVCILLAVLFMVNIEFLKSLCESFTDGGSLGGGGDNEIQMIERTFDYGPDRGPHAWNCSDANQSPINIIEESVQKFPIRELLTWNHYDDVPNSIIIQNNGHTVILRAIFQGNTPTLSGADLLASYTFVELCFRWGQMNTEGSEHMINYQKFPLELQVMHRTGPPMQCTSSYDLLMISYVYELACDNIYLEPLVQNLFRIQRPGSICEIDPFPLSYLCYPFRTGFYSYGGSMTEPPCYQGAEWFLYPEPLSISERQLYEFRRLLSADGHTRIQRNARPVQELNSSRVISFNQYNPLEAAQLENIESECQGDDQGADYESME